jgi:DNA topoisomerase-3
MTKIAIITEKSSVSKPMAEAMGWVKSGMGFVGKLNGDDVTLNHARGHLLTMEDPDVIDPDLGWNSPFKLAPLPRAIRIVPIIEEQKPGENKPLAQDYLSAIGRALKDADEVILATDADREGEYIGWLILEHFGFKKKVRRCWLGEGMDEVSMKKALSNLLPSHEKKSLARAAEARARCDYAYMYLVRLLTFYGRRGVLGQYLGRGAGRESVVSAGRVQSAALYMIYKLEMEIANFVPKTFYNIFGNFGIAGATLESEYLPRVTQEIVDAAPPGIIWEPQGTESENKLPKARFTGTKEVQDFKARLMAKAADAKVTEYKEGKKEKSPPITHDLVSAKGALSKKCGINGDIAQLVIEDLYEQGFISYPRTAHGELPNNLYEPAERDVRLKCVMGLPGLSTAAQKAMDIHGGKDNDYKPFKPAVYVSKKLEHHGLIPSNKPVNASTLMRMTPRKALNNKILHTGQHMAEAYTIIAESYVTALLPPAVFATQRIVFTVPTPDMMGEAQSRFSANASRIVDHGYLAIMNLNANEATNLPKLQTGASATVEEVILKEGTTKKPSRYSESNFERALQKAAKEVDDPELRAFMADGSNKPEGIGTPATRKDIIPTLKARQYIKSDSKGVFFLEPKGKEFIEFQATNKQHFMYKIETTAEWEGKLQDMTELEDDAQAIAMRDRFVEDTFTVLEGYINWMNDKFSKVELKELPRVATTVTDRMKDLIRSISERKGIPMPKGVLSDPKKASEFLNEHAAKSADGGSGGSSAPSEAQLGYLAKVEAAVGIKASDEVRADRKLLSEFLDKHKNAMSATPPSEAQVKFAKSLAAKLPADQQPPESVYQRMDECRKFIDKHKSASGGSSGGSSNGARGSARPASAKGKR